MAEKLIINYFKVFGKTEHESAIKAIDEEDNVLNLIGIGINAAFDYTKETFKEILFNEVIDNKYDKYEHLDALLRERMGALRMGNTTEEFREIAIKFFKKLLEGEADEIQVLSFVKYYEDLSLRSKEDISSSNGMTRNELDQCIIGTNKGTLEFIKGF